MSKWKVLLNEENRIWAASMDTDLEGAIETEIPDDFDILKQHEYRLVGGELVHDPMPEQEPLPDPVQQRLDEQEAALIELAGLIAGGDV